jgi:hypothetical protein
MQLLMYRKEKGTTKKGFVQPKALHVLGFLKSSDGGCPRYTIFSKEMGVHSVILERDAQIIILALQAKERNGSRNGQLVEDTRIIVDSLSSWKISHIHRNVNVTAHRLAKLATRNVI